MALATIKNLPTRLPRSGDLDGHGQGISPPCRVMIPWQTRVGMINVLKKIHLNDGLVILTSQMTAIWNSLTMAVS